MIPGVLTLPADPDPCAVLGCAMQTGPVEVCRDYRCPHRWQREAAEDRQAQARADAKRRADVMMPGAFDPWRLSRCNRMGSPKNVTLRISYEKRSK